SKTITDCVAFVRTGLMPWFRLVTLEPVLGMLGFPIAGCLDRACSKNITSKLAVCRSGAYRVVSVSVSDQELSHDAACDYPILNPVALP
ncbi:MAG TPA: hypothetical protein VGJ09_08495, partial [Bryobacteraceae bacterium]